MLDKDFYIKNGLIYGIASIVYLMVTYLMGISAMTSMWNSLIQFLVFLGLFVYIGLEARKIFGGYMSFSDAFKSIFLSFALGAFLYLLFNFVLNTMIDPALPGKLFDSGVETAISMMEKFGMGENEIEKVYDEMISKKEEVYDSFTLGGFFLSYVYFLLFGAIGAAIAGAITKKNNPNPFAEVENNA